MADDRLTALADAHADLRPQLLALEGETARAVPDMATLAAVRLKLSQESRKRGALIAGLADAPGLSDPIRAEAQTLRQDLQTARATSADHVARWSTQSIAADWPGYQAASQAMRAAMQRQIDRETRLLQALRA